MSEWRYIPGDFWRICDRCGQKYRQSDTRSEWNGWIVCTDCWEPRHPQLYGPKPRADQTAVRSARPGAADVFASAPLTTTLAVAAVEGAVSITVADDASMTVGDMIRIEGAVDGGDTINTNYTRSQPLVITQTTISALPGSDVVTLTDPLRGAADSGSTVTYWAKTAQVTQDDL